MMKQTKWKLTPIKLLLFLFFIVTVLLPLVAMLGKIRWETVPSIVFSQEFRTAALHSLSVTVTATVLSVAIAYVLAFAVNRSRLPCKGVISVLATLPMLIPSISHGLGLVNLFGTNGLLTKLWGIDINLYGFNGIVLGSVIYSFPVAFLMLSDALKYADGTIYEAAQVLGIPRTRGFLAVTLPYMKRPLISASFAVFTMVFTDYGVPLAIGGRYDTLPVYLYREIIGLMDFSKGAIIGIILLLPAVVTFLIDLRKKDNEAMGLVSKPVRITRNRVRDGVLIFCCTVVLLFVLAVLSSFAVLTFVKKYPYDLSFTLEHIQSVVDMGLWEYLGNSLLISTLAAVFGTAIGYITAYVTARTRQNISNRMLHLISISSLAIPGIVLGLGYVTCFSGSFLYGTIAILVFVNIIHFFSSPYMMAYNALKKLNPVYEDVGKTLRVGRLRLLRDVFLPSTIGTILEMASYFFVNSMITISAVAFLYKTSTMPLSLLLNQLQGSMMLEAAAFVSLFILFVNIIMKVLVRGCRALYEKVNG